MSREPLSRREPPAGVVLTHRSFPRLSWKTSQAGSKELLLQKRLLVGSAAAADLVLDDPTISRMHVELDPREEGLMVRDLDSRNGTFVGGVRVREALVAVGTRAELKIGTTAIDVDYGRGETAPVELWASSSFHHLVGQSPAMRELFAVLARIAATDASILVRGETGTGKEVVARSIHEASLRRNGPYVVVDCAALPENLLDAELFGHTRGAFTGAVNARAGAIETASGGTVFLDEIGELPMSMQPKLLRVLEQRAVRRIGESTYRPVDVRFLSATHRDLLAMVARGEFREDLYFRLGVIPLHVPPLRDRLEDIDLLVRRFLQGESLGPRLMDLVHRLPWRGNVRELRNFVERALALGEEKTLRSMSLPTATGEPESSSAVPAAPPGTKRPTAAPSSRVPASRAANPFGVPTLLEDGEGSEGTTPVDRSAPSFTGTARIALGAAPVGVAPTHEEELVASRTVPPAAVAEEPKPAFLGRVESFRFEGNYKAFRERWLEIGEREFLERLLERHDRNVGAIARETDIDRTYVYRLIRKYNL